MLWISPLCGQDDWKQAELFVLLVTFFHELKQWARWLLNLYLQLYLLPGADPEEEQWYDYTPFFGLDHTVGGVPADIKPPKQVEIPSPSPSCQRHVPSSLNPPLFPCLLLSLLSHGWGKLQSYSCPVQLGYMEAGLSWEQQEHGFPSLPSSSGEQVWGEGTPPPPAYCCFCYPQLSMAPPCSLAERSKNGFGASPALHPLGSGKRSSSRWGEGTCLWVQRGREVGFLTALGT